MAKVKDEGLTIREQKFVTEYIKTGDQQDSALKAYNTKSKRIASVIAHQVLNKPRIQKNLQKALFNAGLNVDKVANTLATNMFEGAGVKATARDSNQAIKLWADLTNAWGHEPMDEKKTIEGLDTDSIVKELRKRRVRLDQLDASFNSENAIIE